MVIHVVEDSEAVEHCHLIGVVDVGILVVLGILRSRIRIHMISCQQIDALLIGIQNLLDIYVAIFGLERYLLLIIPANMIHRAAFRKHRVAVVLNALLAILVVDHRLYILLIIHYSLLALLLMVLHLVEVDLELPLLGLRTLALTLPILVEPGLVKGVHLVLLRRRFSFTIKAKKRN
jgi:hypothetical protein